MDARADILQRRTTEAGMRFRSTMAPTDFDLQVQEQAQLGKAFHRERPGFVEAYQAAVDNRWDLSLYRAHLVNRSLRSVKRAANVVPDPEYYRNEVLPFFEERLRDGFMDVATINFLQGDYTDVDNSVDFQGKLMRDRFFQEDMETLASAGPVAGPASIAAAFSDPWTFAVLVGVSMFTGGAGGVAMGAKVAQGARVSIFRHVRTPGLLKRMLSNGGVRGGFATVNGVKTAATFVEHADDLSDLIRWQNQAAFRTARKWLGTGIFVSGVHTAGLYVADADNHPGDELLGHFVAGAATWAVMEGIFSSVRLALGYRAALRLNRQAYEATTGARPPGPTPAGPAPKVLGGGPGPTQGAAPGGRAPRGPDALKVEIPKAGAKPTKVGRVPVESKVISRGDRFIQTSTGKIFEVEGFVTEGRKQMVRLTWGGVSAERSEITTMDVEPRALFNQEQFSPAPEGMVEITVDASGRPVSPVDAEIDRVEQAMGQGARELEEFRAAAKWEASGVHPGTDVATTIRVTRDGEAWSIEFIDDDGGSSVARRKDWADVVQYVTRDLGIDLGTARPMSAGTRKPVASGLASQVAELAASQEQRQGERMAIETFVPLASLRKLMNNPAAAGSMPVVQEPLFVNVSTTGGKFGRRIGQLVTVGMRDVRQMRQFPVDDATRNKLAKTMSEDQSFRPFVMVTQHPDGTMTLAGNANEWAAWQLYAEKTGAPNAQIPVVVTRRLPNVPLGTVISETYEASLLNDFFQQRIKLTPEQEAAILRIEELREPLAMAKRVVGGEAPRTTETIAEGRQAVQETPEGAKPAPEPSEAPTPLTAPERSDATPIPVERASLENATPQLGDVVRFGSGKKLWRIMDEASFASGAGFVLATVDTGARKSITLDELDRLKVVERPEPPSIEPVEPASEITEPQPTGIVASTEFVLYETDAELQRVTGLPIPSYGEKLTEEDLALKEFEIELLGNPKVLSIAAVRFNHLVVDEQAGMALDAIDTITKAKEFKRQDHEALMRRLIPGVPEGMDIATLKTELGELTSRAARRRVQADVKIREIAMEGFDDPDAALNVDWILERWDDAFMQMEAWETITERAIENKQTLPMQSVHHLLSGEAHRRYLPHTYAADLAKRTGLPINDAELKIIQPPTPDDPQVGDLIGGREVVQVYRTSGNLHVNVRNKEGGLTALTSDEIEAAGAELTGGVVDLPIEDLSKVPDSPAPILSPFKRFGYSFKSQGNKTVTLSDNRVMVGDVWRFKFRAPRAAMATQFYAVDGKTQRIRPHDEVVKRLSKAGFVVDVHPDGAIIIVRQNVDPKVVGHAQDDALVGEPGGTVRPSIEIPFALGNVTQISTRTEGDLAARYVWVPLAELQPTHQALQNFELNPRGLPNERQYQHPQEGREERKKVHDIADAFDRNQVFNNAPISNTGPPIVNARLQVLGGNGRTMGLILALEKHPRLRDDLRRFLLTDGVKLYGGDAEAVSMIPGELVIPVRMLESSGDDVRLSSLFNEDVSLPMAQLTKALGRADSLTDESVTAIVGAIGQDTLRGALHKPHKADKIVQPLLNDNAMTENELLTFRDPVTSGLNAAGVQFIEAILLGRVVGDVTALTRMPPYARQKVLRILPDALFMSRWAPDDFGVPFRRAMMMLADMGQSDTKSVHTMVKQQFIGQDAADWMNDERAWGIARAFEKDKELALASKFDDLAVQTQQILDVSGGRAAAFGLFGQAATIQELMAEKFPFSNDAAMGAAAAGEFWSPAVGSWDLLDRQGRGPLKPDVATTATARVEKTINQAGIPMSGSLIVHNSPYWVTRMLGRAYWGQGVYVGDMVGDGSTTFPTTVLNTLNQVDSLTREHMKVINATELQLAKLVGEGELGRRVLHNLGVLGLRKKTKTLYNLGFPLYNNARKWGEMGAQLEVAIAELKEAVSAGGIPDEEAKALVAKGKRMERKLKRVQILEGLYNDRWQTFVRDQGHQGARNQIESVFEGHINRRDALFGRTFSRMNLSHVIDQANRARAHMAVVHFRGIHGPEQLDRATRNVAELKPFAWSDGLEDGDFIARDSQWWLQVHQLDSANPAHMRQIVERLNDMAVAVRLDDRSIKFDKDTGHARGAVIDFLENRQLGIDHIQSARAASEARTKAIEKYFMDLIDVKMRGPVEIDPETGEPLRELWSGLNSRGERIEAMFSYMHREAYQWVQGYNESGRAGALVRDTTEAELAKMREIWHELFRTELPENKHPVATYVIGSLKNIGSAAYLPLAGMSLSVEGMTTAAMSVGLAPSTSQGISIMLDSVREAFKRNPELADWYEQFAALSEGRETRISEITMNRQMRQNLAAAQASIEGERSIAAQVASILMANTGYMSELVNQGSLQGNRIPGLYQMSLEGIIHAVRRIAASARYRIFIANVDSYIRVLERIQSGEAESIAQAVKQLRAAGDIDANVEPADLLAVDRFLDIEDLRAVSRRLRDGTGVEIINGVPRLLGDGLLESKIRTFMDQFIGMEATTTPHVGSVPLGFSRTPTAQIFAQFLYHPASFITEGIARSASFSDKLVTMYMSLLFVGAALDMLLRDMVKFGAEQTMDKWEHRTSTPAQFTLLTLEIMERTAFFGLAGRVILTMAEMWLGGPFEALMAPQRLATPPALSIITDFGRAFATFKKTVTGGTPTRGEIETLRRISIVSHLLPVQVLTMLFGLPRPLPESMRRAIDNDGSLTLDALEELRRELREASGSDERTKLLQGIR